MGKPINERVHMVFPRVEVTEAKVTKKGEFLAEFCWLGGKRVIFGDDAQALVGRVGQKITVRGVPSDNGQFLNDLEFEFHEPFDGGEGAPAEIPEKGRGRRPR